VAWGEKRGGYVGLTTAGDGPLAGTPDEADRCRRDNQAGQNAEWEKIHGGHQGRQESWGGFGV